MRLWLMTNRNQTIWAGPSYKTNWFRQSGFVTSALFRLSNLSIYESWVPPSKFKLLPTPSLDKLVQRTTEISYTQTTKVQSNVSKGQAHNWNEKYHITRYFLNVVFSSKNYIILY